MHVRILSTVAALSLLSPPLATWVRGVCSAGPGILIGQGRGSPGCGVTEGDEVLPGPSGHLPSDTSTEADAVEPSAGAGRPDATQSEWGTGAWSLGISSQVVLRVGGEPETVSQKEKN